jgi:hypothetical protein
MRSTARQRSWPGRSLVEEPGRGLLVVAGALFVVASLLPWAEGVNAAGEPLAVRPTEGLGEGVYMLFGGLLLLALGATRLIAETSNRLLQLVPFGVALLAGAMWLNANGLSLRAIETWQFGGGSGAQTIAPWLAAAGVAATVAGAIVLELRRPDEVRQQTRSVGAELGINRRGLIGALVAAAMGVLGGAIAMGATVAIFGIRGILPGIVLGTFGFLVGLGVGTRIARRLNATA